MIEIDSLTLNFSTKVLFDGISVNIGARDRIGLVGSNGAGKSTFLKILMGLTDFESGTINCANYVTIGYLPQDGIVAVGKSLFKEVESAFDNILTIQKQLEDANLRLDDLMPDNEEYYDLLEIIGALEHRLEDLEASRLKSKIEKVLMGLGFSLSDMDRECGEFSGGWQMRIALAKLLLREPSLLLLDEPTNHLDLTSLRWVENYLKKYEGALMIISHDRAFLDELCTRTFALSLGKLEVYSGNFSYFERESALRKEQILKAYKNQQKSLEKTQQFIDRFRSKASKASQVQSRIKAMAKIDRIEIDQEESSINFRFPKAPPGAQKVLELKNISKAYDDFLVFKNVNFKIEKGDRIAVVGVNGAGKTTFAKVLAGVEPMTSGERLVGQKVQISYFAQHQGDTLNPEFTVLEILENAATAEKFMPLRAILGAFLFRGDDAFKKTKVLSGGEKCRLALACLLVQQANCLVMDEPTNHLDMRSKKKLQDALLAYEGTLFIVSHDRAFLDPLVNKVLEISRNGTRVFLGNVSEYLERIENEIPTPSPAVSSSTKLSSSTKDPRKEYNTLKKKSKELEDLIQNLETQKTSLEETMSDPQFFAKGNMTQEAIKKHLEVEKKLEITMKEWMEVTEQLKDSPPNP